MALIEAFEIEAFVEKISSMNSSSEIKLPLDKQKTGKSVIVFILW